MALPTALRAGPSNTGTTVGRPPPTGSGGTQGPFVRGSARPHPPPDGMPQRAATATGSLQRACPVRRTEAAPSSHLRATCRTGSCDGRRTAASPSSTTRAVRSPACKASRTWAASATPPPRAAPPAPCAARPARLRAPGPHLLPPPCRAQGSAQGSADQGEVAGATPRPRRKRRLHRACSRAAGPAGVGLGSGLGLGSGSGLGLGFGVGAGAGVRVRVRVRVTGYGLRDKG